VKRFRESGKISDYKGQEQKPLWPWSPQAALQEKLSCHHDQYSHMGSGGAWKTILYLTQSTAASRNVILNLYYTRRKPYIKHGRLLWTQAHLRWTERQCSVVRWVHISAAFGKNWRLLLQRWDRASRLLSEKDLKPAYVIVWVHQCPRHGWLHMCEGTIDAKMDVGVLERHMLPSKWRLFPGGPYLFSGGRCQTSFCTTSNSVASYRHSVCAWLACLRSTSVSYRKCTEHHEEENQFFLWKTATISLPSSQTIKKCH